MTNTLKTSIWADREFWREQRAKWEESQRELAEMRRAMLERLAERHESSCTGPHTGPSRLSPTKGTPASTSS